MDWLRLPMGVLSAYVQNLPRMRAEGALEGVSVTMIGTGSMEKRHAERALRDWQREAAGTEPGLPPKTEEEKRELYASSGFFEVEVVPGG